MYNIYISINEGLILFPPNTHSISNRPRTTPAIKSLIKHTPTQDPMPQNYYATQHTKQEHSSNKPLLIPSNPKILHHNRKHDTTIQQDPSQQTKPSHTTPYENARPPTQI